MHRLPALLFLGCLAACGRTGLVVELDGGAPRCGDGVIQPGEACDDGNADDTDFCLSTCVLARCGDGVVQRSVELCDPGAPDAGASCTANCTVPSCGNGVLEPPEQCDDGNQVDTDACPSRCLPARCGDGVCKRGSRPVTTATAAMTIAA